MALLFPLFSACDDPSGADGDGSEEMVRYTPAREGELIMSAIAIQDSDLACPPARRIELLSRDSKLRIDTEWTRNPNCGDPPALADPRTYTVHEIYDFEGQTVFSALSPRGALLIYDQRSNKQEREWTVEVFDYSVTPTSMSTFIADTVTEKDLDRLKDLTAAQKDKAGPLAAAEGR
jgi:hypothetical protein